MTSKYESIIPKHLQLWLENDKLRYKAAVEHLDEKSIELLKDNKSFFIDFLNNTGSQKIEVYPLAQNQKALWFLYQLNPKNISYNIAIAGKIENELNIDVLSRSFSILAEKHWPLRAVLCDLAGKENISCQIVTNNARSFLEVIDCKKCTEKETGALVRTKYKIPFNLENGPLFKIYIFECNEHSILLFNIHHIICDAISLKRLMDELIEIYGALLDNKELQIKPLTYDYSNFMVDQVNFLNSIKGKEQLAYWKQNLKGQAYILDLPYDADRPMVHNFNGGTSIFEIKGENYSTLLNIAKNNNCTINVLLFTIFELFLFKVAKKEKFCIGTPVAARTRKEFESIAGYFINMLAIGCSFDKNKDFAEYINDNKKKFYSALENQDIPFPVIVENLSPIRDLSRTPIFQVMFNYLDKKSLGPLIHFLRPGQVENYANWGPLKIKPYKIFDQEGQFDLTLEILNTDNQVFCAFKYNADLFKPARIDDFITEFKDIVQSVIENVNFMPNWEVPKEIIKDEEKKQLIINITGTFTTEPVQPALELWLKKLKIQHQVNFLGYNQIFQQLLDPQSEINLNSSGFNILMIRFEDWIKDKTLADLDEQFIRNYKDFNTTLINALKQNTNAKFILCLCPPSYSLLKSEKTKTRLHEFENEVTVLLKHYSNAFVITPDEILKSYNIVDYYEPLGETVGHIPYKDDFFTALSTIIARKINSIFTAPFKAIAVDCDNTLWKGVVGEDGPTGISIGPIEKELQEFLIKQYNEGLLICLVSKNIEEDVFAAFEQNPQMILKREHIAFHKINWNSKSDNILALAKEINIGVDSFVFIDDNSIECAEVLRTIPDVLTIQKKDDYKSTDFLANSWAFDRINITEEDRLRTQRYMEEANRSKYKASASSYKDFIDGLNLKIDVRKTICDGIPRVSQLTYRTNQFNFTTIRRNESEVDELIKNERYDCFEVDLSDRFGDYGTTGVIVCERSKDILLIDTFLLSCRILGKGVEHYLVSYLGKYAQSLGLNSIQFNFRKTTKNIPAEKFLESNFSKYQSFENQNIIYRIPTEFANQFTFNPNTQANITDSERKDVPKPSNINIDSERRNEFYIDIIENYSTLDQIKQNLFVNSKSEIQTSKSKDEQKIEDIISNIWKEILGKETIRKTDNFFDIGGHSVLIPKIVIRLENEHNIKINIVDIFQYPTIESITSFIKVNLADSKNIQEAKPKEINNNKTKTKEKSSGIAIIGMAGRFSGAENIQEYWDIIKNGIESITYYSKDELIEKGVNKELIDDPNYVYANGLIESADKFDSTFFGFTPREADCMDPQHRIFLETCYEALENAGYDTDRYDGSVGVFAGAGMNNYILKNLFQHPEILRTIGEFQSIINNNTDFLSTRVSYKLNLRGPSMSVQTACSTSMVAIHLACQNLLNYECDMALSGGAFIQIPRGQGYMFEPGGIFSPSGHCRPFDKDADGTLFGEGAGVVVLKRIEDAIVDHDTIWAVIKGSAINNDGAVKVGYMAPSVQGQVEVMSKALSISGISPKDISYIETHGTGTNMGDPIEVSALSQTFRPFTDKKNYCAIGSVKANIGHLDAAAGVAGLIKTSLALKYKQLPPSVNFKEPNPELHIENSPFYVNTKLTDWKYDNKPLTAAVSAFGVGGTNVHCIIQEAPIAETSKTGKKFHLLPLSGKTAKALEKQQHNLLEHLKNTGQNIADIAFTLQSGRKHYKFRNLYICESKEDAITQLEKTVKNPAHIGVQTISNARVVFMYTGQGNQYTNMAKGLYSKYASFKDVIDKAHYILKEKFNIDLLQILFTENEKSRLSEINNTAIAQPLIFAIQYATTKLLAEFGIRPDALIGHSIGELTAACISGVFNFESALQIVAHRGRLMQNQKPGAMLSIQLTSEEITPFLNEKVSLALMNAPGYCVVSGDFQDIDLFKEKILQSKPQVHITKLNTSHAFHSYMMDPALAPFKETFRDVHFGNINIPFVSNTSGTWADEHEIRKPDYWVKHIRSSVNFVGGMSELLKDDNTFFIEVGPGESLATLLTQFPQENKKIQTVSTIHHAKKTVDDVEFFYKSIIKAWNTGANIIWPDLYKDEIRYRVPLPTYPFERRHHWIDAKIPFSYHKESTQEFTSKKNAISEEEENTEEQITDYSLHERPALDNEFVAPETENEKLVVKIWEELLGIKGIGITDDFFYLGGHSLLASQAITRINENFKINIPLETLFNAPTIKQLCGKVHFSPSEKVEVTVIKTTDSEENLSLTFDQKRLWVINMIDNNNPAYNIPFTYKLCGKLNVGLFIKSINILFKRHKILLSSIKAIDGNPFAYLNTKAPVNIELLDFSQYTPEQVNEKVQVIFGEDSRKCFNIETGPLYRLYLAKIGNTEHIFHMTVQHMVFDGWSWGIFAKELKQIYNDLYYNRDINLRDLEFQYFDYANWQEQYITDETYKESIKYWKEQLKDPPLELKFPYDYRRPEIISGLGGRESFSFSYELSNKLKDLGHKENATLFMTVFAAFSVLLSRYTSDEDICIGTPSANRGRSALEDIIGFFVNTLVIRMQFNDTNTFNNILQQTKKTIMDALAHQDLPFEKLVDILQPARMLNINPIFQVLFAWQNTPRPPLDFEGITPERIMLKDGISPLDITFYMWEDNGMIEGEIEFNEDILSRETIINLKDNFVVLAEQLIKEPDKSIYTIPLLSPVEQEKLAIFNNTHIETSSELVHNLFENQVRQNPKDIAVICGKNKYSYLEIDNKSNQLANYLKRYDIGKGDYVGLCLERSEDMIVAVLAILKTGACYLPMDPAFPEERTKYMFHDAGAKILLTQKSLAKRFRGIKEPVIELDNEARKISKQSVNKPVEQADIQSLAYIIYTSGSTGKPKGVKVHHGAVVNFLMSMSKVPGLDKHDQLLAVTTLSFDISVLEIFLPLSKGATTVIAKTDEITDGRMLAKMMESYNITVLQATPATWTLLLASGWQGNKKLKALCGGEAVNPGLVKDLLPVVGSLWNMYGPTETTVWSTCCQLTDPNPPILVGKPIDNTQIYILNNMNNIQPTGVVGEVCIGGLGVTKGYHNRDELTSEKFINGPDHNIIYKTGDLGRLLHNGNIELYGRIDNQVKLRGFRIEPGEIESLLTQITGIKEAVVKIHKFSENDERLIAFLNITNDFNLSNNEITTRIGARIPNYMVPSIFIKLNEFPRTPNGKIDKKLLIYQPTEDLIKKEIFQPSDEVENKLYQLWKQELKTNNFGIDDNFFNIGGHSLIAISLVSKIEKAFSIELDLRYFFDSPTIKDLAKQINILKSIEIPVETVKGNFKMIKGEL